MDDITFLLAVWGAFLSTYLALREVKKDKRQLKIILENVHWLETRRLVISNTGHRPITIDQVAIQIADKRYGVMDPLPQSSFWENNDKFKPPELPLTLEDGKMAVFYLSGVVVHDLYDNNKFLRVKVIDAEGNIYSKYSKGEYDPKYGYRSGEYKPPGFIADMFMKIKYWWMKKRHRF